MNVLIDINHPAHVHLFKNAIWELERDGHTVKITARNKDIALELLDEYDFDYTVLSNEGNSFVGLAAEFTKRVIGVSRVANDFSPDVYLGLNPAICYASKFVGGKSIILHDTEPATLKEQLFNPVADEILTPECFKKELNGNQVRYPGYHELAYLHPDQFDPDPSVLDKTELSPNDQFAIVRLVSWESSHDVGDSGFDNVQDVVSMLETNDFDVLITSEAELEDSLKDYQVSISPSQIHDLMYYSDLYVGESATMATESAVLGTPSVLISSNTRGYTDELNEYGLVFSYSSDKRHKKGVKKVEKIVQGELDSDWEQKRQRVLKDKIDTTSYLVERIKNANT
ncbi:DUF354 domain-containing protein [Halorubrum ezzemoulense]|uniref:DUF354 domain-containing protein n=1 Tax=Halorubrum ezzemoulense TaxID=337243 RepID=UPI00232E16FE|nr:DUF354 domain-containing protein [Halorubrum ezzemoulense]MDB2269883.1 DUF354 domain-containing protein [Halorubrum ezzemoulense]